MNKHIATCSEEVIKIINYFNSFHDGVIKSISFKKDRDILPEDGGIVFPGGASDLDTTVIIEIILNSYENAKIDQILELSFEGVERFFMKQNNFDFSSIYEVEFKECENSVKTMIFKTDYEKIEFLEIIFKSLQVLEK